MKKSENKSDYELAKEKGTLIEFKDPLTVLEDYAKEHRERMTSEQRMMYTRAAVLLQLRKGEAW
jgi:hypothetical protein